MVLLMCELLFGEKFVQISVIITFLLISIIPSCAKKKKSKGRRKNSSQVSKKSRKILEQDPDDIEPEAAPKPAKKQSAASFPPCPAQPAPPPPPPPPPPAPAAPHIPATPQAPAAPPVAASPAHGDDEYKPPPEHEKPKHPGFETPVEPAEETKTQYQIDGFADAADFV